MSKDNSANKLINWNGVSRFLTGDSNVVRSNNVKVEHREAIESLIGFVNQWVKLNCAGKEARLSMHFQNKIEVKSRKKRTSEKFYKVISDIPEDAEKITPELWAKNNVYYTSIYDVEKGFEFREWRNISKAKIYLNQIKNK